MKLVALFMVFVAAAAATAVPSLEDGRQVKIASMDAPLDSVDSRNLLVDVVVNQAIAYIRRVINNGSPIFGIPPLDPLNLEHFHFNLPAGLINLDLTLNNVYATGFGGFVINRSKLAIRDLTLELDFTFPKIIAQTELYDFIGDLFTAIPLFGNGKAEFLLEGLRIRGIIHLKQSEDGKSILIDKIEDASFELPNFKAHLTGVIGGGNIDAIVNTLIEEVIIDYVRRFNGAISVAGANLLVTGLNPILGELDTWRYIARFL